MAGTKEEKEKEEERKNEIGRKGERTYAYMYLEIYGVRICDTLEQL